MEERRNRYDRGGGISFLIVARRGGSGILWRRGGTRYWREGDKISIRRGERPRVVLCVWEEGMHGVCLWG